MSDFDWAVEFLRQHGVADEMVRDVDGTASASLASARRLAAALSPADPLPLVLDTTAGDPR